MYSFDARALTLSGALLFTNADPVETQSQGHPIRNLGIGLRGFIRSFMPTSMRKYLQAGLNPFMDTTAGEGQLRNVVERFDMTVPTQVQHQLMVARATVFAGTMDLVILSELETQSLRKRMAFP